MAIFMIETESVSSSGDSIKTISSELSSISSNVSGYDVNCEDNFNFSGAKQVIAHNIEACSTKMSNTSKLIETVVSSHNNLQSQLKFNEEKSSGSSDDSGDSSKHSYGNNSNSSGRHSGGSSHSSGGSHSGGGSHSSGGYSGSLSSSGIVSSGITSAFVGSQNALDNQKISDGVTSALLNDKFSSVAYAAPNENSLNDDAKKFLNNGNLTYKDGYAMIDGRYVISCDSSYGKVGDIIRFTKNDGSVVECVIGVNTSSDKYKSTLNFIVDKDNPPASRTEFFEKIVENSSKIENIGNVNSNSNSSVSTNPTQSVTESSTTTTESSENSTSTDSSTITTESSENSTSTDSSTTTTESSENSTSTESDVPITNDETLTPFDGSTDFVLANNSSSLSDENLNSLMSAKTDEDVKKVLDSIISSSSNNSNNV